jgi:cytochrome c
MTIFRYSFRFAAGAMLISCSASAPRAQDVARGEQVFGQCRACHQIGDHARNSVGPHLNGVIGRPAGTVAGYSYSEANQNSGVTWDEATFIEYIKNPRGKIPGTKMTYAGLKDEKRIKDLIAFLKQFDESGRRVAGGVPAH